MALLPLVVVIKKDRQFIAGTCYGYTQQSYVDSLVQAALYGFNEAAADLIAREQKMREAITDAKSIARKLRQIAQGDANEKYILWRVNELEGQIYLEENDLKLNGANATAKAVNELIGPFNDALNQKRPDFKRLHELWNCMQAVDQDKASEMEVAIYNRRQIVTRSVVNTFENALTDGNSGLARGELVYCSDNQGRLAITLTQYGLMAAKFQARSSAGDEQVFIAGSLKDAEARLAQNKIADASGLLHVAQARLSPIRDAIIRQEWDKLDARARTLLRRVAEKEDSLVRLCLRVLDKKGIQSAGDFLDSIVSPQVADRDKIAQVNEAIMAAVVLHRSEEKSPVSAEIAALTSANTDTVSLLDDLAARARQRSKARRQAAGTITQPEEVRRERMQLAAESMRKRQEQAQSRTEALTTTEEGRQSRLRVASQGMQNRREEALRFKSERAHQSLIEIYTLLEQKKEADAYHRFTLEQATLKEFLPAADYDILAKRMQELQIARPEKS